MKSPNAAQTELEQLAARELELHAHQRAKLAELEAVDAEAGTAYLQNHDATDAINCSVRLRVEIEALRRAADLCRTRRAPAIQAEFAADAQRLRAKAAGKRKELAVLETRTRKLLTSLCELEGIEYTAAILSAQPDGYGFAMPRSTRLVSEIGALDQKASEIESQEVPSSGLVDLEGVIATEELVRTVLAQKATTPSIPDVEAWYGGCEAMARNRGNLEFGTHPRRVRLIWSDGIIDAQSSSIFVAALARETVNPTYGGKGLDVASGTFQAIEPAAVRQLLVA